jgi:hypothetical protein
MHWLGTLSRNRAVEEPTLSFIAVALSYALSLNLIVIALLKNEKSK